MKDYKKYFRTLEKVEEDLLLPFLGLGEQPGTEVRMAAMTEVLRRIPEEDYEILKRKKSTVIFNGSYAERFSRTYLTHFLFI